MSAQTILIVEDEVEMREFLQELLAGENLSVHVAADGAEALQKTLDVKPDLVLLDLRMPKLNGVEFCKTVRADKKVRDIPIVVLTAQSTQEHLDECIAAGADDFIAKPFEPEDLVTSVQAMLQSRHITEPTDRARHYAKTLRKLRGEDE